MQTCFYSANRWLFLLPDSQPLALANQCHCCSRHRAAGCPMAQLVHCDGIDLDIEAGDETGAGDNLVAFITQLKQLVPNFHVSQPVYGTLRYKS